MTPVVCICGIDPGLSGAIAFYFPSEPGRVLAEDMPCVAGEVDVDTPAARIMQMRPTMAMIERVSAMPKQGVSSTFKFGVSYGAARAVVAVLRIPMRLVTPPKWKGHFRLDADKEKARALALQLWPGVGCFARKRDHGRAEAALLARYAAETFGGDAP